MTAIENDTPAPDMTRLKWRIRWMRKLAFGAIAVERLSIAGLPMLGLAGVFAIASWFGAWRYLGWAPRFGVLAFFTIACLCALLRFRHFRLPTSGEIDNRLEEKSGLANQALRVQTEKPANRDPVSIALWKAHQQRMARKIKVIDAGAPYIDIARQDPYSLRGIIALGLFVAWAFSWSNHGGRIDDAFTSASWPIVAGEDSRIDAWVTPPSYTGAAPVYLTGKGPSKGQHNQPIAATVPQFSVVTVRISGPASASQATFAAQDAKQPVILTADKQPGDKKPPSDTAPETASYTLKLVRDGEISVAGARYMFTVTPDQAPKIKFAKEPNRAVNGALEIAYAAEDDYGVTEARAEIEPLDQQAKAIALFDAPVFRLDIPGSNSRTVKATASHDLTEHPLSGKKVKLTLVARDATGHEGRSDSRIIVLPARNFSEPLAGSIAEQRQVFSLDVNQIPRALQLSDAAAFRADETIANSSHFLLLQSTRTRLKLANSFPTLEEASAYFWDVARYIEDGDLSNAEKRLRDAQQKLSDALSKNASDKEIEAAMKELRAAMKDYLSELAKRMGKQDNSRMANQAQRMMRAQDIDKMLNQLENLARSGSREEAQKLLSEMQRMLNNMQTARPKDGRQPGENPMRDQIDKLGELMQNQQKLMDETHRNEQALRDRMQRGDSDNEDGLEGQDPFGEMPQQGDPKEQPPVTEQQKPGNPDPSDKDKKTTEQLRKALRDLKQKQSDLQKDLKALQKKLSDLGMKPLPGFGEAGKEMGESAEALGKSQGQRSADAQGRALEALRKGAGEMMQQLREAGNQGGQGMPMPGGEQADGNDPLGRKPGQLGSEMDDQVKVPDQIDIQRAREILEEIRKRLGNGPASIIEKEYLERLLDMK